MEPTSPWSQSFDLRWRPCLDYYEHKVALLRGLKDRRLLRQFRIGENQLSARLAGSRVLDVSVDGMIFLDAQGPIRDDEGQRVLMEILHTLRPVVTQVTSWYSHLLPLDWELDYPTACLRASHAFFGHFAKQAGLTDFAVLVDGVLRDLKYQAEFGVVSGEEAPLRIARICGNRIGGPEDRFVNTIFGRPYPSLGLFMDSQWTAQENSPGWDALPYWLVELGRRSEGFATELLRRVYSRVQSGDNSDARSEGGRYE